MKKRISFSELSQEEKLEKIRQLRPIDDIFFEVLADDAAFCQEMLRVILEDAELVVEDVVVQSSERNIYGRSVRLDALCTLESGAKVNVEVQRSDNDNHFRRVRFNESVITAKDSDAGEKFKNVEDLYVVYISEFDFIGGGKTTYHVTKVIHETGEIADDGIKEIYVNTAIDDGTDIAELMACFKQTEVRNPKFPVLSERIKDCKDTGGGLKPMCKVMQELLDNEREIGIEEGLEKGLAEGITKGRNEGLAEGHSRGLAEGHSRGLETGKLQAMLGLVADGLLSPEVAAVRCNMTVDEFLKKTSLS